jgi:hypothetical protein
VVEFEIAGKYGKLPCNFTGNLGGFAGGIKRERIEPYRPQAVTCLRLIQILEEDAKGAGIGKWEVGFPGQREVCKELEGVADIDDNEEGWPALRDR